MTTIKEWMRFIQVVRASDYQCRSRNSPGFDPSILRNSGIGGAADEAVLKTVRRRKKIQKIPLLKEKSVPLQIYSLFTLLSLPGNSGFVL